MRIRRSLISTTSSAAHTSSSDPDHNHNDILFTTPTRCSSSSNNNTKTGSIIICVFNQSPWDVNDLSSLQLDGGLFSLTGIAPVPKLAIGSQSFGFSVKLCVEEKLRPSAASDKCLNRRGNSNVAGLIPPEVKIMAEKRSHRRKVVSPNKPQIRAFNVKKQQVESSTDDSAPKMGMKRRGRAVKNTAADPNEFYYYSGFGPHWGKKRETVTKSSVVAHKLVLSDNQELQIKTNGGTKRDIEFMDYDDDDEDDNDIEIEENEGMRRPRGRKRVKARSLKSLM